MYNIFMDKELANIEHIIMGINAILADEKRLIEKRHRLIKLNKRAIDRLEALSGKFNKG